MLWPAESEPAESEIAESELAEAELAEAKPAEPPEFEHGDFVPAELFWRDLEHTLADCLNLHPVPQCHACR